MCRMRQQWLGMSRRAGALVERNCLRYDVYDEPRSVGEKRGIGRETAYRVCRLAAVDVMHM